MKKLIAILMAMSVLLLAACGKKEPVQEATAPAATQSQPVQTQVNVAPTEAEDTVSENDFRTRSLGNSTCEIVGCSSNAKIIKVPETLFGEIVVGIGNNGLNDINAKEVILPNTVEYLESNAFISCANLETVDLGSGLKWTGARVFINCNNLLSVSFPEGMEEMRDICFGACEKVGEVYVPASVTTIANGIANYKLCPNIIVVTPAGSTAEAVAQEDGIPVRHP